MASVKKRAKTALQICGKANDKIYRDSLVKTAKALMKLDNVEIISHRAPDGDTLGCSSALCRGLRFLGKKANVVCADAIPDKYAFLFDGIEPQALEAQHFVTVDIAAPHLMGKLKETYENKIDVCIDHHIDILKRWCPLHAYQLIEFKADECLEPVVFQQDPFFVFVIIVVFA